MAIVLDSKWKKGRIEFPKVMEKDEMDLIFLSAIAEIKDSGGKIGESEGGVGSSTGEFAGYLKVATVGAKFASAASGGGGGV